MACLGVHFALPEDLADQVNHLGEAEEVVDLMDDHFKELKAQGWTLESGKGWDPVHRCLTGGGMEYGDSPEYQCILGSGQIWDGEEWIVNFLDAEEVQEVSAYIDGISENELRQGYEKIDPGQYAFRKGEEDFQHTWRLFNEIQKFYRRAAEAGRWVAFVADQ
ncbi:MAG: DUF1877 family protein [Gemmataceae bacterium]